MAKVKQSIDEKTAQSIRTPAVDISELVEEPALSAENEPAVKREKKKATESARDPEDWVEDVLRAFPGYETLYVDRQGGAFSPDTLPAIRGAAVLYRNPFHKS